MYRMKGVIPPMITPFLENGDLDLEGLRTLVRFLRGKVGGLFITGSYGSGVMMTAEERKRVAEVTLEEAGDTPVIVHVGTADSRSAADLTAHARALGVAAVSAVGPFYYKHGADAVCRFYADIKAAAGPDLPVYVYNNPGFQGYPMDLSLIRRLKEEVGLDGIKDATFDIMVHANYHRLLADDHFDIASGTEALWLQSCVLGTQAFIPGLGNVFPEACYKMWCEGMNGDYGACRETQLMLNEVRDIMYLARSTQLAIYAMLEIRGVLRCYPRAPFIPATDEEKTKIRERLLALKMI